MSQHLNQTSFSSYSSSPSSSSSSPPPRPITSSNREFVFTGSSSRSVLNEPFSSLFLSDPPSSNNSHFISLPASPPNLNSLPNAPLPRDFSLSRLSDPSPQSHNSIISVQLEASWHEEEEKKREKRKELMKQFQDQVKERIARKQKENSSQAQRRIVNLPSAIQQLVYQREFNKKQPLTTADLSIQPYLSLSDIFQSLSPSERLSYQRALKQKLMAEERILANLRREEEKRKKKKKEEQMKQLAIKEKEEKNKKEEEMREEWEELRKTGGQSQSSSSSSSSSSFSPQKRNQESNNNSNHNNSNSRSRIDKNFLLRRYVHARLVTAPTDFILPSLCSCHLKIEKGGRSVGNELEERVESKKRIVEQTHANNCLFYGNERQYLKAILQILDPLEEEEEIASTATTAVNIGSDSSNEELSTEMLYTSSTSC